MRRAKFQKYGISLLYLRFLNVRQVILVIRFLIEVFQSRQVSVKYIVAFLWIRIKTWSEDNKLILERQNGFRKGQSAVDHISSLTQIIETRKKLNYLLFVPS